MSYVLKIESQYEKRELLKSKEPGSSALMEVDDENEVSDAKAP